MGELPLVLISLLGGAILTMVGVWLLRLKNLASREEVEKLVDEKISNEEKIWQLKFENTNQLYDRVLQIVEQNNTVISEFKNELHDFKIELTELRTVLDVAKTKKNC